MASSSAARVRQSNRTQQSVFSIGQVLSKLVGDFPDLTLSKLRFLEDQGLIIPERTPSGYRKFSSVDLERIRFILTLQRDNYLPLKVIRKHLHDLDQGIEPSIDLPGVSGSQNILSRTSTFTRDELITQTGASMMLFQEGVSYGLLPAAQMFGDDSVKILRSLVELQKTGIEPRHLRGYRAAVDREVGLIEVAVMPYSRRKDANSKAKAAELSRELSVQLENIRNVLLRNGIEKFNS